MRPINAITVTAVTIFTSAAAGAQLPVAEPPAHLAVATTVGQLEAGEGQPFRVEIHGSGPPVILIPGLMSSGAVWDGVVQWWSHDYQLHVLTLAGFAGVPAPNDSADFLERARNGVISYIRQTGLDRPAIVGHSLGGFLALWIASTEPQLTRAVVAVDGVPYLVALGDTNATAAGSAANASAIRQMYASLTPEHMALQAQMSLAMMISDSNHVATAVEWARESDPASVGSAMAGMMVTDIRLQVQAITAPVLLLAAGGAASSPAQLERLRTVYSMQLRDAPRATTVVAEKALHFIMLDDPGFFHRTVDPFLAASFAGSAEVGHE